MPQQRYFAEPYRFIPPYRSTFWCPLFARLIPGHLRRSLAVHRWRFEGLDTLRASLDRKAGIVLAVNHSRWADPAVVGMLSIQLRQYFYYLVSYHLFHQGRFAHWYIRRCGGFSVWREGIDRQSLRVSARIVAGAERPLVIFPEGTWFRSNDRVGLVQEGASLIARHAVRQTDRAVLIHPVAIKYWYLEDPRPALARLLEDRERQLWWPPQRDLDFLPRLEKIGEALLATQELRHFGKLRPGSLDERARALGAALAGMLEDRYLGKRFDGMLLERVRRLRQQAVRRLGDPNPQEQLAARDALDTLLLCENLNAQSLEYLRQRPSLERLAETILRLEEAITDNPESFIAPLGAVAAVGPAIDVRDYEGGPRKSRRGPDPLLQDTAGGIQVLLDRLLAQGPPAEWNCPSPIEGTAAARQGPRATPSAAEDPDRTEVLPSLAGGDRTGPQP